jgi:hypothetical protein
MVTRLTLGSSGHASMKGYFRDNSSFRALKAEPPSCFTDLEPHFEPLIATLRHPECDPVIALAANLCRRLADVIVYAWDVKEVYKSPGDGRHLMIATRLVGYYSACKALLDAGAITLTTQYGLVKSPGVPLPLKEQDFAKGAIWTALERQHKPVFDRYKGFRKTIDDVRDWRDAIVHRVTPLTLGQLGRFPGTNNAQFHSYVMALDRGASLSDLLDKKSPTVPPTYHHDTWGPDFERFCIEVCADIKATS